MCVTMTSDAAWDSVGVLAWRFVIYSIAFAMSTCNDMWLRCSQPERSQMSSALRCKKTCARLKTLRCSEMEIENLICYTERAVGLKPSAIQGEARLRGLYRSIYSKTLEDETTRIILLFQRRSLDPGMRRITARKSSTQRRTAETLSAQRMPTLSYQRQQPP